MIKPTWYMYGSAGTYLREVSGTLRTAQPGSLGAHGVYFRMGTHEFFSPPYTFSGKMKVYSRMTPPVFNDGTPCHYDPGIVFHAMHDMESSPWPGNEENIVMGFASSREKAYHSVEIGGPGAPYGPRTGWESRRKADDIDPADGAWHDFRVEVYSHKHYALFWDDVELLDVVEKEPASMYGRVGIGLRLDFFDVEMRDMIVIEKGEPSMAIPFDPPQWAKAARPTNVLATGSSAPPTYAPIASAPTGSVYTHRGHAAQYGKGRRSGRTIRSIIVHVTAGGDLEVDYDDFVSSMTYEMWRPDTVSATAMVGEVGEIGLCVPEEDRAWTTGRWNDEALTMEIIGRVHWSEYEWRTRPKQIAAVTDLIEDWCRRHNIPPVWLSAAQYAEGASREGSSPVQGVNRGIVDHLEANKAAILLGGSAAKYSHNDIGPGLRAVLFADILPEVARRLSPSKDLEMKMTIPAQRAYDSRKVGAKFKANEVRRVQVGASSSAVFVNLISVASEAGGYLKAWGAGPQPEVSHLNFAKGVTVCNGVWVPVSQDGYISVLASSACHVVVDVLATA